MNSEGGRERERERKRARKREREREREKEREREREGGRERVREREGGICFCSRTHLEELFFLFELFLLIYDFRILVFIFLKVC